MTSAVGGGRVSGMSAVRRVMVMMLLLVIRGRTGRRRSSAAAAAATSSSSSGALETGAVVVIVVRRGRGRLLLQGADFREDLQLDVVGRRSQAVGQIRVDEVLPSAEVALARRLDHDENVGVDHGGDFHRRLHQDARQLQLHGLKVVHETHEGVAGGGAAAAAGPAPAARRRRRNLRRRRRRHFAFVFRVSFLVFFF